MASAKIIFKIKFMCIPQSPLRELRVLWVYSLSLNSQSITSKPVSCSTLPNSSTGSDECSFGDTKWLAS